MYKKIFISLVFFMTIFSGCSTKNNISNKDSYKFLDEVSIIGIKDAIKIKYFESYNHLEKCKMRSNHYFNNIISVKPLIELLKEKNVKIRYIEPTKKLLVIKAEEYISTYGMGCEPSTMIVSLKLYDVENISKNWSKNNIKVYAEDIKSLNDKMLIYSKEFRLDSNFDVLNSMFINNNNYEFNLSSNRDVNNFFKEVIKDLEKVMKFPQ
ncbi:hypothetical protein [Aliarcobacter butzleri]|uniref:hypothetical protein n=1 Tax=Aliarcobacter butzleri TaxID=28197 RepID=UPI001EDC0E8C|nr:hypothetical protein [Aliarcobacter butzleri]MCG3658451.1 hypothetical protein [Aliarcobacter butzleri]MCG3670222.1 hypothetical protein [Aliarcobacter butzleri]MCG3679863.1 hypothetical protein [Aliarcobacter butzleri]MDN5067791.1 hypothetical protein [Aliarcobacter butzleri]